MKKIILFIIALCAVAVLVACGGDKPKPVLFEVSFNVDGGTSVASQRIESGAKATKPQDPTKVLYDFSGWYKDASFASDFDFTVEVITKDTVVYVKWTIKPATTFTVMFSADGGTPIPSNQTIQKDGLITKPSDPAKTGYTFGGWYKDSDHAVA